VIDAALADLEFQEVLGAVAGFAAGPLGAARVRGRRPTADLDWIREELALVGEVAAVFRRGDKVVAEPVPDLGRALARLRIEGSVLELPELRDLRIVLSASRLVDAELRRVADQAPRAAALAVPLPDKTIDRRLELSVGDDGELLDTASPALAAARREIQAARQRLVRKLEGILRGLDPQATIKDAGVTVRGGRYVIPVRRDSRARPGGIVHDESASAGTLFVEPSEAVELGNAYREAQAEEEREVLRVLRELTAILRPARDVLTDALEMCVRVDDVVARARYAVAVLGEEPEMVDAGGAVQLLERGIRCCSREASW
jgi:DNA mismatch repair protein MutS2